MLSLRRPLAQKWENEHDAACYSCCQGKACDRAGWAHSIMVAAAKGAAAVGGLLVSGFGQVLRTRREEDRITSFPRRLMACWCASYEGWRFLEADKCATFPILGSRLQWRHHGSQVDVGHSPGNSGNTSPDLQALERGRRHFGARCRVPQDGASPHSRSGQASGGGPPGARPTVLQGQIQSRHRGYGQAQARPSAAVGVARD